MKKTVSLNCVPKKTFIIKLCMLRSSVCQLKDRTSHENIWSAMAQLIAHITKK